MPADTAMTVRAPDRVRKALVPTVKPWTNMSTSVGDKLAAFVMRLMPWITASAVPGAYIALTLVGYALVYTLLMISYMVVITQLALKEADGGHAAAQPEGTPQPVAG